MRKTLALLLTAALFLDATVDWAIAGMPSALPQDFVREFRLSDSWGARLQAISFFLLGLALAALAVMGLWNFLRRDFPRLPRLTFGKSLAVVVAWGLLFVIVLTMISGARELMTPGAWKKQGILYSLDEAPPKPAGASVPKDSSGRGSGRRQATEHK